MDKLKMNEPIHRNKTMKFLQDLLLYIDDKYRGRSSNSSETYDQYQYVFTELTEHVHDLIGTLNGEVKSHVVFRTAKVLDFKELLGIRSVIEQYKFKDDYYSTCLFSDDSQLFEKVRNLRNEKGIDIWIHSEIQKI